MNNVMVVGINSAVLYSYGDVFHVALGKQEIENALALHAPDVRITASQMTEEGYYLMVEGDEDQVVGLGECFEKVGVLIGG